MEEYKTRAEERWRQKQASFDRDEIETIAWFLNKEHNAQIPIATASQEEIEAKILRAVGELSDLNPDVFMAGVKGLEETRKMYEGLEEQEEGI